MSDIVIPRGPRATGHAHHHHASCPPLAILRPKSHDTPSEQHMSYRSCYEFHRSAARAIDAGAVLTFRGHARAVLANVRVGVDGALADRRAVERHLPYVPVGQLLSLADVARALVHADAHGEADDRDRLWTLLTQRHAFLRKVGWYFHGERCDDAVPPLDAAPRRALDDEDESFDALG